jgi:type I restriction enzyme M protein
MEDGETRADPESTVDEQDDAPVADDLLVDLLTGATCRRTDLEEIVQRTIVILAREYRFPLESMGRDVPITVQQNGNKRRKKADLVVFEPGQAHELEHAQRVVVVRKPGTKATDRTNGTPLLEDLLDSVEFCEFGLWTNGRDVSYIRKVPTPVQNRYEELADFPGAGESIEDLERPDRRIARVAATEDLRETVLRCHDYLYGNQSMTADRAFAEMVKIIFAKVLDERLLRASTSYRRQFWVGLTERNHATGQTDIAARIRGLFEQLKHDRDFRDVFRPGDEIELKGKVLAWVAGEIARYSLLDAEVDVKGMAYEAIVAATMKKERGQFFTPRNIVEAMVAMLDPQAEERVLDPACGSGRFLVACLDRFRRRRAQELLGSGQHFTELHNVANSPEVVREAGEYARSCLFGVDVDPQLVRAAKMNMIINNDGHGNLHEANSLEMTKTQAADSQGPGHGRLAFESFDVVLTNPPFGTRIPIDDSAVLAAFDLGHRRRKNADGTWFTTSDALPKMPPEILFIERCIQWLKPGGRMGIVVPDGILGNPDNEHIRAWILEHAKVLASVDLPVEAFQPQVGVQSSLLFLEKRPEPDVSLGAAEAYPIFMAIAESVGHDRRGKATYRRDPDGYDVFEDHVERFEVLRNGEPAVEERVLRRPVVADDLPLIAHAYGHWVVSGELIEVG